MVRISFESLAQKEDKGSEEGLEKARWEQGHRIK
jgi:hypothetical protein